MVKLILLLAFFCVGCSDTFNEGSEKIVYNIAGLLIAKLNLEDEPEMKK